MSPASRSACQPPPKRVLWLPPDRGSPRYQELSRVLGEYIRANGYVLPLGLGLRVGAEEVRFAALAL